MASNNGGGGVKEERRRRIAERGSDRMALITGRINALPPTAPSSNVPRHAQSFSVAGIDSHSSDKEQHLPPRHSRPQSYSPAFSADFLQDHSGDSEVKQEASNSSARLKHQGGFRYSNMDNMNFEVDQLLQDSDTISEVNQQVSEADDGTKTKPSSITSRAKDESIGTQYQIKESRNKATFFSSRELNLSIIATETTRALSSLIIAVLVVFYYMISESVLASRPLYIVFLTDITIVIARLHREKPRVVEEPEGERVEAHGDGHSWGDAVKLLERGLVAYQAIRGLFIDCSIYLVVVVCGTSLM